MEKKVAKLEFAEKYTYNTGSDTYVIPLKNRVKPLVLKGYKLRAIRRAMSNVISPAQTAGDICQKFKLLTDDLDELKKIFGMTRDSFPLTAEEVDANTIEKSAEIIREEKQAAIHQLEEKLSWKATQEDAEKWREFQDGSLDMVKLALDGWEPPKAPKEGGPRKQTLVAPKTLMFVMTDWHVGGHLQEEHSFHKNKWNVNEFRLFKDGYKQQSSAILSEVKHDKVILMFLGDILDGLRGKTEKGTVLNPEIVRDAQFREALDAIVEVTQNFLDSSSMPIEMHCLRGNHDSVDCFMLFEAVRMYFKDSKRLTIKNHKSRNTFFEERGNLFCADHGASDTIEAKIPQGARQESYIQSLWIQYAETRPLPRHKYFIQGDLHHFEVDEKNDFEFIMCGSPSKSLYSEVNNWRSRPSQVWLTVSDRGVENICRMFFD